MLAVSVMGVILGLALTGFLVYLSISYASRKSAYDSAAACSSSREIAYCRFDGSASVVAQRNTTSNLLVDLQFNDLPDNTYTAYFAQENASSVPPMQRGSTVAAELWQGNVTIVAGAKTLDNPDTLPTSGPPVAIFFGVVTLIVIAGTVYLFCVDRRAARG